MTLAAVLLVGVVGLVAGAFLADRAAHQDRVVRNVVLDGEPIGGVGLAEFEVRLRNSAADHGARPVVIDLDDVSINGTADGYGYALDAEATLEAVSAVGRVDGVWAQFTEWVGRLRSPVHLETRFVSSPDVARESLTSSAASLATQPVEPEIRFDGTELTVDVGAPGRQVDIDATLEALVAATSLDSIVGVWKPVPQTVAPGEAISLFTALKGRIDNGLVLHAVGAQSFVSPATAASWITADVVDDRLVVQFDEGAMATEVEEAFFGYVTGDLSVSYEVVDGEPLVAEVSDTRLVCCGDEVVERIVQALEGSIEPIVELPLRPATEDEQAAAIRDLGVVDPVASFTTFHNCCESRVTNIHRIADLVQGVVLMPGTTFSVNEHVGERTRENGFVAGGVIYQGEFESDIGGGISQYATTLFNAAFFAGLDFPQYQSHSLYLPRYPYGREATVSFPEPDLVVANPTPYAVLVWSEYDARSITVTLYSTQHIEVSQFAQDVDTSAACTRVTTHRLRVYPDGTEIEDAVYAFYRPTAGYDCGDLEVDESTP